jgi:ABC-type nickel/cobalt efflux system permease component RcnA
MMETGAFAMAFRSLAVLAIGLLTITVGSPSLAQELATWEALAPSVAPYDDPFVDMPYEQIDDLRTILRAEVATEAGIEDSGLQSNAAAARARLEAAGLDVAYLFAQREVVMERRREAATGVTQTHLGDDVLIDGFVLPLKAEAGRAVEFLLVPWVGACIHTPPPAPNQIVHVAMPGGVEVDGMFTAVRLRGRLAHRPADHDLFLIDGRRSIPVAYAMDGAAPFGAPGDIVPAATAGAELTRFEAAQAWITNLFTTAMTNLERGRTAGATALAILIAFAYGVLHTLGPGHGKAVVISYFVGSGGSLRRGLLMGGQIAVVHVLSAVVLVFLFDLAVRQTTGAAPSDYRLIRLGSYGAIIAIGAVMLWRAIAAISAARFSADGADARHGHHDHAHEGCAACAAERRGGGYLAAAVGAVPCTGALIVMLFGLANDLVFPATLMVAAISAGMAVAMAAIGVAAILGRRWMEARIGANEGNRIRFELSARVAGAACVLLIGTTLFGLTYNQTNIGPPTTVSVSLEAR